MRKLLLLVAKELRSAQVATDKKIIYTSYILIKSQRKIFEVYSVFAFFLNRFSTNDSVSFTFFAKRWLLSIQY